jgi:BlaI family penicillinase repressor
MFQVTDLQLTVLRELWNRGEASVAEVHGALQDERGLATTTVATLLSRLEKRSLVTHRTDGRKHIYRATVTEPEVQTALLNSVTDGVFGGDVTALVSHLLTARDVSSGDLAAVQEILDRMQDQAMDTETNHD